MLLAIDTATRAASLALYREEGIIAELSWRSRDNHTVETMEQITRLLALVHATRTDLLAVGIALGPGSFTGLRVGMSIAKGLAFGQHIPLIGIPTLDGIAYAHAYSNFPLWAILEAGRGRFIAARYKIARGLPKRESDYALVKVNDLLDLAEGAMRAKPVKTLFCGDVDTAMTNALTERLNPNALFVSPTRNMRRAGFLAELAWARWQRGEVDEASSIAPTYLAHESVEGMKK
jgi:tRNA threonylcarbamoyladenosine biosynthesis protein TsaB